MTNVLVYDCDAKELEEIAERNDCTVAEVVELLMDYLDNLKDDNGMC